MKRPYIFLALCPVFLLLLFYGRAEAYLDPGTGSLILQMLVAAFFGVAFAVKSFWKNIKAFFARNGNSGASGQNGEKL